MSFCDQCGFQFDNDVSRFCPKCGAQRAFSKRNRFPNESLKSSKPENNCPKCGAVVLNGFQTNCSFCGYQFHRATVGSTVTELSRRLEELESQRKYPGTGERIAKTLILDTTDRIGLAKANIISNFIIPNTKEDILDFMILATSNIVPAIIANNYYGNTGYTYSTMQALHAEQEAWCSKMEQAYAKAKISFRDDPLFAEVERLYLSKKAEIDSEKQTKNERVGNTQKQLVKILVILFVFIILSMLLMFLPLFLYLK